MLVCTDKAILATSPSSCFPAAAQAASTLGHFSPLPSDPGSLPTIPSCGFSAQATAPSLALKALALCTTLCKPQDVSAGRYHSSTAAPFLKSRETTVSFLLPPRVPPCQIPRSTSWGGLCILSFWMKMKIISSHLTPYHMHKTTDHCTICNLFEGLRAILHSLL